MFWLILLVVALLVLFWWGSTQYSLANCMADAANPARPTHRLVSEFGWQKAALFKLYLARRSMRNNNTILGTKEVRLALNMGVEDFMVHGHASPSIPPLELKSMAEEQSMLAMAYALDTWKEAKPSSNALKSRRSNTPSLTKSDDGDESGEHGDDDEELDDLDRRAKTYHQQIDAQIESTHTFLRDTFGEEGIAGRHSLHTLSVFTVHAATLIAIERNYPELNLVTLNGFTQSLGFRTPDTQPEVESKKDAFAHYASIEAAFMHDQTDEFELRGVEPLIRDLLKHLGGNRDGQFKLLAEHVDRTADKVARTYLPHLGSD